MSDEQEEPIHKTAFKEAKEQTLESQKSQKLSRIFKVLGDSTRVKILCALKGADLCVHDLSVLLGVSQSAISHQLRKLRDSRIVKYRKEGRTVFYSLDDEHVEKLLEMGIKHAKEE